MAGHQATLEAAIAVALATGINNGGVHKHEVENKATGVFCQHSGWYILLLLLSVSG